MSVHIKLLLLLCFCSVSVLAQRTTLSSEELAIYKVITSNSEIPTGIPKELRVGYSHLARAIFDLKSDKTSPFYIKAVSNGFRFIFDITNENVPQVSLILPKPKSKKNIPVWDPVKVPVFSPVFFSPDNNKAMVISTKRSGTASGPVLHLYIFLEKSDHGWREIWKEVLFIE